MKNFFITIAFFLLHPMALHAAEFEIPPLSTALDRNVIRIDSGFSGDSILLYGARNVGGHVVTVVRGPAADAVIRRKERKFGVWLNTDSYTLPHAPRYLFIASDGTWRDYSNQTGSLAELLKIPAGLLPFTPTALRHTRAQPFIDAWVRYQGAQKSFAAPENYIIHTAEPLFQMRIPFSDRLPRGIYTVETYVLDSTGRMLAGNILPLEVYKSGVDGWIYNISRDYPVWYGLAAVFLAVFIGVMGHFMAAYGRWFRRG